MACIYTEHDTLPVAELRVTGHVTENDMNQILPQMAAFIEKHGKIRIIEIIESFEGFDPATIWKGIRFDAEHLRDVTHAAVVTDIGWIGIMTQAASWMVPVTLRMFPMEELGAAREWAANPG